MLPICVFCVSSTVLVLLRHFFSHLSSRSNRHDGHSAGGNSPSDAERQTLRRNGAISLLPLTAGNVKKKLNFGFEWLWLNVSVCQVLRFWKMCLFMILNLKYACDAVKVDCFQSQLTLWLQTCDLGQRCLMCLKSILETWHCRRSTISSISDVTEYS